LRSTPTRVSHVLLLFLFIFPLTIAAQEYRGSILGHITDPQGFDITNASIEARSDQQTYTHKTDSHGNFVIPLVQPGTYTVAIQAPGFRREVYPNQILSISQKLNLSVRLTPGGASDVVTVTTDQLQLATTDASGGTVMDPEKVQNLPLNGRQVYMLMSLTPGVRFTQTQFGAGGYSGTRGWDVSNSYSINGQQGAYNQFMLNGAPISVQGGGSAGSWNISPSIDAVQEFKVMTITFDAQYGRVGGGAMNTILKSGTPSFHGTVYDYWRTPSSTPTLTSSISRERPNLSTTSISLAAPSADLSSNIMRTFSSAMKAGAKSFLPVSSPAFPPRICAPMPRVTST
jgi:hypothetical protein